MGVDMNINVQQTFCRLASLFQWWQVVSIKLYDLHVNTPKAS